MLFFYFHRRTHSFSLCWQSIRVSTFPASINAITPLSLCFLQYALFLFHPYCAVMRKRNPSPLYQFSVITNYHWLGNHGTTETQGRPLDSLVLVCFFHMLSGLTANLTQADTYDYYHDNRHPGCCRSVYYDILDQHCIYHNDSWRFCDL